MSGKEKTKQPLAAVYRVHIHLHPICTQTTKKSLSRGKAQKCKVRNSTHPMTRGAKRCKVMQNLNKRHREQISMHPSAQDILTAAELHLTTHQTVGARDIYYLLGEKRGNYRQTSGKRLSLRTIAQTLLDNGYTCAAKKSKGYSQYKPPHK